MNFGQQVKWLDGQNWHFGTVVARFDQDTWGVTHVMNPNQSTQAEFRVKQIGGVLKTFHEKMTQAEFAYTNPGLQRTGRYQPSSVPTSDSVPLGSMVYKEQYQKMMRSNGR